jgi:hypothetical protein
MWDTQLTKLTISMIEIFAAVVMHAFIVYLCYKYKDTIYKGASAFYLKWQFILGVCFVLAMI